MSAFVNAQSDRLAQDMAKLAVGADVNAAAEASAFVALLFARVLAKRTGCDVTETMVALLDNAESVLRGRTSPALRIIQGGRNGQADHD